VSRYLILFIRKGYIMFHRPKTEDKTSQKENVSQGDVKQGVSKESAQKPEQSTTSEAKAFGRVAQAQSENIAAKPSEAPIASEPVAQKENITEERKDVSMHRPFRREDMDAPIRSFIKSKPEFTKTEEAQTMTADQNSNNDAQATPTHNPFTRPAQTAASARPQQAYTPPASYTPTTPATGVSNDRRLVIGAGITMSGEIEACDCLVIEGTVEAALKGARVLDVTETGVFYGAVEIEEATIAGRFEGDILVNGRLTIKDTGSVTGVISYRELQVEAGANIDGRITPIVAKVEKREGEQQPEVKKVPPRNDNVTEQPEGELPLANNVAAAE
jgi:cytoskeletal protein CcmA (bactofilin family)